jgi:hypothetical protein
VRANTDVQKWEMEQQLQAQKEQLDFDKERHKAEMEMAKEQMKMQSEMQKVSLEYQDQWNEKQNELTRQQMEYDQEIAERKEDREDRELDYQRDDQEFQQETQIESTARDQEQQDYAIQRQREEDKRADAIVEEGEANDSDVAYMFLQNCGNAIKKATFGTYNILIVHGGDADEEEEEFEDAVFPLDPVKVMMPSGRTRYYRVHIFKEGTYIRNGSQAKDQMFFWPPQARQLGMVDEDDYEEEDEDEDGEEEDELDGEEAECPKGGDHADDQSEADCEVCGAEEIEGMDEEEDMDEEEEGEEEDAEGDAEGDDGDDENAKMQAAVMPRIALFGQPQPEETAADKIAKRREEIAAERSLEDEEEEEDPLRLVFTRMEDVPPEVIETLTRAMIDDAQIDSRLFAQAMGDPGNVSAMIGASGADLDEEQETMYAKQGQDASYADQAAEYYDEDQQDPYGGQGPMMQGTDVATDAQGMPQDMYAGAVPFNPIGTKEDPPPPPPPGGQLPQLGQAPQVAGMDRALDPMAGGPVQPPSQMKSAADMQPYQTSGPTGPMQQMGTQNGGGSSGTGAALAQAGATYMASRPRGGGQQQQYY